MFDRPEKGFNIDETNADGESILHLCATRGDAQRVELLVAAGADLALQNAAGNTPLHVVVEESIRVPAMKEAFLEVFVLLLCQYNTCFWSIRHMITNLRRRQPDRSLCDVLHPDTRSKNLV